MREPTINSERKLFEQKRIITATAGSRYDDCVKAPSETSTPASLQGGSKPTAWPQQQPRDLQNTAEAPQHTQTLYGGSFFAFPDVQASTLGV